MGRLCSSSLFTLSIAGYHSGMSRKTQTTLRRLARKSAMPRIACDNPECGRPRSAESKSGLCRSCHAANLEPPPDVLARIEREKDRLRLAHLIDCAAGKTRPHGPVEG